MRKSLMIAALALVFMLTIGGSGAFAGWSGVSIDGDAGAMPYHESGGSFFPVFMNYDGISVTSQANGVVLADAWGTGNTNSAGSSHFLGTATGNISGFGWFTTYSGSAYTISDVYLSGSALTR